MIPIRFANYIQYIKSIEDTNTPEIRGMIQLTTGQLYPINECPIRAIDVGEGAGAVGDVRRTTEAPSSAVL